MFRRIVGFPWPAKLQRSGLVLLFLGLLMTGCAEKPALLPEGTQTITGILEPAELSLVHRGTHTLRMPDEYRYFVESNTLNLREFEGKEVTLHGVFTVNADPSLPPILLAEELEMNESDVSALILSPFEMSIEVPTSWLREMREERMTFMLSGSLLPVLAISRKPIGPLPAGMPIVVGNEPGVRAVDEATGNQTIVIERPTGTITLLFTPPGEGKESEEVRRQFIHLLRSLTFTTTAKKTENPQHGSGSGIPCGGSAGVLCPQGMYCEVADWQLNIGSCKRLGE